MVKMEMMPVERVMAAIQGRPFDVFPAISPTSVATLESMKAANAYYPAAHVNAKQIAQLAAVGHDHLGFDSVTPYFSIHLESSALGVKIDWGGDNGIPKVEKPLMRNIEDFSLPDAFLDRKEFQQLLKACKILKKKYNGEVAIIGKVIGPWTLAYNLYGVNNLILDTILEPQKTKQLIQELSGVPIKFAKAQFEAGADIIVWAEHCTSDLVSSEIYREFIFPVHKHAAATLQTRGPLVLHICGNVMDRLDYIADTGFKMFHIDSRNDSQKALQLVGERIQLICGINNPVTLAQGMPADVKKEVETKINHGFHLIAPECAVPSNVPNRNLLTLVETLHRRRVESES